MLKTSSVYVLKNRAFDGNGNSFLERNASESSYFRKSNFKTLPQDCLGIESLRDRLSQLLFEHVKQELPQLREDLQEALADSHHQLDIMGDPRSTAKDCKAYLAQLSLDYYEVCKAAVGGHYEGSFFTHNTDTDFSLECPTTTRRLRAVIQKMNEEFSENIRKRGHKYHIEKPAEENTSAWPVLTSPSNSHHRNPAIPSPKMSRPAKMSVEQAQKWVSQVLFRTRGRELPGNFNPLLVGELFWEQSSNWHSLAEEHIERVASVCCRFLEILLSDKTPKDMQPRLWSTQIHDALRGRNNASIRELKLIIDDLKSYPINYNHYYTDTIKKRRRTRESKNLAESIEAASRPQGSQIINGTISDTNSTSTDVGIAISMYSQRTDPDMESHSCEEALDCLFAIYKVRLMLLILYKADYFSRSLKRPLLPTLQLK